MDYENKKVHGIHMSRYLASFIHGYIITQKPSKYFWDWLSQLKIDGERLTSDEIEQIYSFATSGKMEMEHDAIAFFKK